MNIKYIISIQTYNSLKNTHKILSEIAKFNIDIEEIIIIDNCSTNFSLIEKKKLHKDLNKSNNQKITFILNENNYGIGGSFKILFNYLSDKDFTYLINLQSSGRYEVSQALKNLLTIQPPELNLDYYLHSRFLSSEDTENYNFFRKIANHLFIRITKIFTKCNFSDPGMAIFMVKKKICNILLKNEFSYLTNSSHFPHFMNVVLYKYIKTYKEFNINWKEGNVKSHLNSVSYPLLLLLNLILFRIKGSFIKYSTKNNFKFKLLVGD